MCYRFVAALLCGTTMCVVSAQAETIYGVTEDQFLITWDSANPAAVLSGMPVTGLQSNESILGIDFRPATGELFALGSSSRLYVLDTMSGSVTTVGAGPFSPAINGTAFGFDFNPTIDRIRLVSDVNKNYVLNPNDGTATEVTDVFFAPGDGNEGVDPNIVHSAYTNSFAGATTSQLYGVDTGLDLLVTQANSAGTLATVGPIGTDITTIGGFDISGATGNAYMVIRDAMTARSTFWSIDLATGTGMEIGEVGGGNIMTALAVAPGMPVPEPASLALFGVAIAGLAVVRYRQPSC